MRNNEDEYLRHCCRVGKLAVRNKEPTFFEKQAIFGQAFALSLIGERSKDSPQSHRQMNESSIVLFKATDGAVRVNIQVKDEKV